jgi:flagellar FliL protein
MAEAKKEEKKEGEEVAEVKPKSKKKLFIIVGVLIVLLVGAGGFVMLGGKKEVKKDEHAEEQDQEKHYETALLDTFIVNLSENSTFLKATILVEYDPAVLNVGGAHGEEGGEAGGEGHGGGEGGEKPAALPALFTKRKPMVHDSIIRVMSSKKASDVITVEGKEQLKQELIEAINEALGLDEAPVVNIYFTEFIIQ